MKISPPTLSRQFGQPSATPFRGFLVNTIRFWEPRRLIYNLILAVVTVVWIVATWPHFRPVMTVHSLLLLAILALIANVLYSAAYFVDLPLQSSSPDAEWKRVRWGLWLLGTVFAILLTNYWIADEIYPLVR